VLVVVETQILLKKWGRKKEVTITDHKISDQVNVRLITRLFFRPFYWSPGAVT
jgi:hypothetical protein